MNSVILTVLFSIIALLGGINVVLLWDGDGIGQLLSMFVSIIGLPFLFTTLFFRSNYKILLGFRIFMILTFLLNAIMVDYSLPKIVEQAMISAHIISVVLCAVGIVMLHLKRKISRSK